MLSACSSLPIFHEAKFRNSVRGKKLLPWRTRMLPSPENSSPFLSVLTPPCHCPHTRTHMGASLPCSTVCIACARRLKAGYELRALLTLCFGLFPRPWAPSREHLSRPGLNHQSPEVSGTRKVVNTYPRTRVTANQSHLVS